MSDLDKRIKELNKRLHELKIEHKRHELEQNRIIKEICEAGEKIANENKEAN